MCDLKGKLLKIFKTAANAFDITDDDSLVNLEKIIRIFSFHDPSKTNKYVEFMTSIFMNYGNTEDEIINAITEFHVLENKITPEIFEGLDFTDDVYYVLNDQIKSNPRDIQNYKTLNQLQFVCGLANNYISKKNKKKTIIDSETDIIYDKDDYVIVSPLSFESSCYWGVDTKWCTTSKGNSTHYIRYSNEGNLIYVIDKFRQNDKLHPMSKFAIYCSKQYSSVSDDCLIFNRPDKQITSSLRDLLPDHIIDLIADYHRNGVRVNLDDVWRLYTNYQKNTERVIITTGEIWQKKIASNHSISFSNEQFPSYELIVEFFLNERNHSIGLSFDDTTNYFTDFLCTYSTTHENRDLLKQMKLNTISQYWNGLVNDIILAYGKLIKIEIYKDIIQNCIDLPINVLNYDICFSIDEYYEHDYYPYGSEKPHKLNGVYKISVSGTIPELNGYFAESYLDFAKNEFELSAGDTDMMSWGNHCQDFHLLYLTENGISDLILNFKMWVVDTLLNKSEKTITDIYQINTNKILSKINSFDDYLKDNKETITKTKIKNVDGEGHSDEDSIIKVKSEKEKQRLYTALSKPSKEPIDDYDYANLPF